MKMYVYVLRRVLLLIPVIIGVMTITFLIVQGIPIPERVSSYYVCSGHGGVSPCQPTVPCSGSTTGAQCPNPSFNAAVHQLGYDQPAYQQWATYISNSLTLHWGYTGANSEASTQLRLTGQTPVSTVLSYFLPYTLELAAISLVFILALSIPIGNYSAVYRNRPVDQAARVLSFSGFALPGFLLATVAIAGAALASASIGLTCSNTQSPFELWYGSWPKDTCFPNGHPSWIGSYLQTSPTGFPTLDALWNHDYALAFDSLRRMLIPALVITYGSMAGILRFVRNSMLEVMNLDFIRTARSKGVPEQRVIKRHAGRNSLNVTVTVLGLTFAAFIGGFPIIEYIFGLRGIGLVLVYSIQPQFDYGLIFGTTLLFTIIVVAANICVDILYAYLDPRVRLG